MKRKLQFWMSALAGSTIFVGCASTKPFSKHREASNASSQAAIAPVESNAVATSLPAGQEISVDQSVIHTAIAQPVVAESAQDNPPVFALVSTGSIVAAEQTIAPEIQSPIQTDAIPINLPSALAVIGGQHPVVGFARWRVQEAYAQLDRAQVMWLPSIQSGFNYRRRDGNYQAVDGAIVDVNLNSFNYGLGAGAVAAGSPTRPGVVAQFHLADAIFLPKAAEKTAWARGHAAAATLNQQLLNSGVAYLDLLEAYQDQRIIDEAVARTSDLAKLTEDFAEVGEGLRSDADRTATELALLRTRQLAAQERQLVASTRLARVLSIPMTSTLVPQDAVAIPLDMLPPASNEATLIEMGLVTRPELKESQALVAAACEAYNREKYAPFVPSVLLGFSTTSLGGGLGSYADNFGGRYDIDGLMVWELRNLGFGEGAARRERNAQVQQANFAKLRIMDDVAQQVAEAYSQIGFRKQQIDMAQSAIGRAQDSYGRNSDRIREGEGLPIEALQAIQALETAQRAYMRAVMDYNRAQLQLQWSLGWPVQA